MARRRKCRLCPTDDYRDCDNCRRLNAESAWKYRRRRGLIQGKIITCTFCGGKGHLYKNCKLDPTYIAPVRAYQ